MTFEQMLELKKRNKLTFESIASQTNIPVSTLRKILNGYTQNPRLSTLHILEAYFLAFYKKEDKESYGIEAQAPDQILETGLDYNPDTSKHGPGSYTIDDYYALPDEKRVELIDGYFYDMAAPAFLHQLIAGEIYRQIANFIFDHDGSCLPGIAPIDVQLDCDEKTMVQPDVLILCDPSKNRNRVIFGAPDFVLEVISPSSRKKDFAIKAHKYLEAGVKEYWIIDPKYEVLHVYDFREEYETPVIYPLEEKVGINIYEGKLEIQLDRIRQWIKESKEDQ